MTEFDVKVAAAVTSCYSFDRTEKAQAEQDLSSLDKSFLIRSLRELSHSDDTILGHRSLERLAKIDPEAAIHIAQSMIRSESETERWFACGILHDLCDHRHANMFLDILQHESAADIKIVAASALGNIGNIQIVPILQNVASSDRSKDHEGRTVAKAASEAISDIESRTSEQNSTNNISK